MIEGCPIFRVFCCTFYQAESNLIFLGVKWMESSNKTFAISHLWVGSLGKLFLALLKLLEKDGKDILTIAGPKGLLSGEVP